MRVNTWTAKVRAVFGFICSLVTIFAVVALAAESDSDIMKFELRPPDRLLAAITGYRAWTIYATGTIDDKAPERLQDLIKNNSIPPHSTVEISSPGGSLMAGMKLGRIFRSLEFNIDLGQPDPMERTSTLSGQCFSACALAFLGGRWRYLRSGSLYGVHRFYFSRPTVLESDIAQMMSAVIVKYIRDMGADPDLFSAMTSAGKDDIILISAGELLRLNVVNNGQSPTTWTIESANGVVYLKGQRDTAFGMNKFILACSTQGVGLTIMLSSLPPTNAISLVADDKEYPIEKFLDGAPVVQNGSVFAFFNLPLNVARVIEAAHEVGVTFQVDRGAPTYVGFLGMRVGDGSKKMAGVLRGCL
jgi:hypothetical protein